MKDLPKSAGKGYNKNIVILTSYVGQFFENRTYLALSLLQN